jgi:hypothetical protein
MATSSFEGITDHNWQPATTYQAVQSTIQAEVEQGLWANQVKPNGWCFIQTSPPLGANASWVTHTYQSISDRTQTASVIWPAGWPAPAENVNGQLPSHFFTNAPTSGTTVTPGIMSIGTEPLHETTTAPTSQPTYKPAGECV